MWAISQHPCVQCVVTCYRPDQLMSDLGETGKRSYSVPLTLKSCQMKKIQNYEIGIP